MVDAPQWHLFDPDDEHTWPEPHLRILLSVRSPFACLKDGFKMYAVRARCGVFAPLLYPTRAVLPANIQAWAYVKLPLIKRGGRYEKEPE